ncbi:MAG: flagellar basal body rod protein FlgB [Oligoflexales bacterium]
MKISGGLFTFSDRAKMATMHHRLRNTEVITGNIANAETPGYRAIGYDFEKQFQEVTGTEDELAMKATNPKHFKGDGAYENGEVEPDVYVRPTESVGQDGNTVDLDEEMARLASNQLLYQSTVELINRKIGTLRYAISSGSR